jgi:alkaline phosphatase
MKKFLLFFGILLIILPSFSYAQKKEARILDSKVAKREITTSDQSEKPKNVILLIGDGMGLAQVFQLIAVQDNTAFQRFQYFGFSRTQSANKFITDSGAGGTALATGKKTNNSYISVSPDTKEPIETLIETANKNNYATGVVVTCALTHATPASFLAHSDNRNKYEEIAESILNTHPTLMIGGGRNNFEKRKDGRNLSDSLRKQGFNVVYSFNDMLAQKNEKLAALLFDEHPVSMQNGRGNYETPAVEKALELLSQNQNGFFLMVEGSQIDWECHNNDIKGLVAEMQDFNDVLNAVLDFAEKDGNTLVVVTADHETGGLVPMNNDKEYPTTYAQWTWFDHTAVMVPVYAYGKGAQNFAGIYHNTYVHDLIVKIMGW